MAQFAIHGHLILKPKRLYNPLGFFLNSEFDAVSELFPDCNGKES